MNNELFNKILHKLSDADTSVLSQTIYKKDIHKNGFSSFLTFLLLFFLYVPLNLRWSQIRRFSHFKSNRKRSFWKSDAC